jgi:GAF domain-containing protein
VTSAESSPFRGQVREFAAIARAIALQASVAETYDAIVGYAVRTVEGAEEAAITVRTRDQQFRTVASTNELCLQVDALQYRTMEGPCLDSIHEHHVFRSDDLATDGRWPVFGRLVADRTEVTSMLSHRLYLEDEETIGALNLYSRKPAAFSAHSLDVLDALATHSAIAIEKAKAENASRNLELALARNRTIGMAMGVLMNAHKITGDEAFDWLRLASQHLHRKLHDIAEEVVETGVLETAR